MLESVKILTQSQHIAVLGMNQDIDSYANKIVRKIRDLHKTPYPINPRYPVLFGESVYASLEKCPLVPDLVVFVVNPSIGITYLNSIAQLGIKYIWLQPGTISTDLLEVARNLGLVPIEACVLVVGNYLSV